MADIIFQHFSPKDMTILLHSYNTIIINKDIIINTILSNIQSIFKFPQSSKNILYDCWFCGFIFTHNAGVGIKWNTIPTESYRRPDQRSLCPGQCYLRKDRWVVANPLCSCVGLLLLLFLFTFQPGWCGQPILNSSVLNFSLFFS